MTRSRDFSRILGRSVTNDTFSATGTITPLSVTSYDYDSAGQLQALNNSSLVDGSLHYLSKTKQLYVWDDSDNSYYPIDQGDSALEGVTPYSFQGSVSGYASGGLAPPLVNTIDKFPFAADGNATDVGDLTDAKRYHVGQSSTDNGYSSGGQTPTAPAGTNVIEKFPFATDGNATDVGDLTGVSSLSAGQSSDVSGYRAGGILPPVATNVIDKFPFATDGNATDVGDLTAQRYRVVGQSSAASGYTSGGQTPVPGFTANTIDKFPFSADANATDVGDLTAGRYLAMGQSSAASGYTSGGASPPFTPAIINAIDKFPFASDGNATDVGDLTRTAYSAAGQSSTVSGYTSGSQPANNTIDKFPFSTDANASDVGDLTVARSAAAGQQV